MYRGILSESRTETVSTGRKTEEERRKGIEKESRHSTRRRKRARKAATKEEYQCKKEATQASKQQHRPAQSSKRAADSLLTSRAKKVELRRILMTKYVDCNRCCTCFGLFSNDVGTEREWQKCRCGRWIHEECVDVDDKNSSQSYVFFACNFL